MERTVNDLLVREDLLAVGEVEGGPLMLIVFKRVVISGFEAIETLESAAACLCIA
jgi:hypothetical protein